MTIKSSRLTTATTPFISEVGGTASYATAAQLPFTNNAVGDKAFIVSTGEVVIWDGSKWTITSTLSSSLALTQLSEPSYTLSTDGTSLVITLAATGTGTVNWTYNVVAGNEAAATIAQNGSEFTITPSTSRANNGVFKILFTAYDDDSVATVASQFVLNILGWYGGRGVFAGGSTDTTYTNIIDYVTIATPGNSTVFGDLTSIRGYIGSCSDGTYGIFAGGAYVDTIDYVTIGTLSNAYTFGVLSGARGYTAACSDGTYGLIGGGTNGSTKYNIIEYVTISTPGNTVDFGDLTIGRQQLGACSNGATGIFAGGNDGAYSLTVDYVSFPTPGNATLFGSLTQARSGVSGCGDKTYGLFGGGRYTSGGSNVIDYITMATLGNATDFGNLTSVRWIPGACSDGNYGLFAGGYWTVYYTVIDYVTITTPGNAVSFGDLTVYKWGTGACSGD